VYSEGMLGRLIGVSIIFAATILWIMLQVSTPTSAGPLGVLLVFILLYVLVLGVLTFLLFGISKVFNQFIKFIAPKKPKKPLSLLRAYYYSSVIALAPVIFIGMQSVGEVSAYDVILVSLFVIVACFYISKRAA
jgi:hypothetical protein